MVRIKHLHIQVHLTKFGKSLCAENFAVVTRLLRLEDILRSHRFYFKAAKMAIEVSDTKCLDWHLPLMS